MSRQFWKPSAVRAARLSAREDHLPPQRIHLTQTRRDGTRRGREGGKREGDTHASAAAESLVTGLGALLFTGPARAAAANMPCSRLAPLAAAASSACASARLSFLALGPSAPPAAAPSPLRLPPPLPPPLDDPPPFSSGECSSSLASSVAQSSSSPMSAYLPTRQEGVVRSSAQLLALAQ